LDNISAKFDVDRFAPFSKHTSFLGTPYTPTISCSKSWAADWSTSLKCGTYCSQRTSNLLQMFKVN